jgi:hypothetical protein
LYFSFTTFFDEAFDFGLDFVAALAFAFWAFFAAIFVSSKSRLSRFIRGCHAREGGHPVFNEPPVFTGSPPSRGRQQNSS